MGKSNKIIVISGINIVEGGALSIFKDCLKEVVPLYKNEYKVIALVSRKNIFSDLKLEDNIEFLEFPKSKKNWLLRCYYEYIYFKKLSKKIKPYLWFSIHDITPNVYAEQKVVYCHNPSFSYKVSLKEAMYDKKLFLFSIFYKYLYKINIKENSYVVVQQNWIKKEFQRIYKINNIIVAPPEVKLGFKAQKTTIEKNSFFYPAFPRVFKNFETICEAAEILEKEGIKNFKIYLTINGNENKYSEDIVRKYKNLETIKFIGLLPRSEVLQYYSKVETLIFPSKLETWGLPITEFKNYNKPIILADLPYAHETVGDYDKCIFFNPHSAKELMCKMRRIILNKEDLKFENSESEKGTEIYNNWESLFEVILRNDSKGFTYEKNRN